MSEATSSTNSTSEPLTIEVLKDIASSMYKNEPFAEFMRREGFDPAKGDVLMLPYALRQTAPPYVQFSRNINGGGVMMKNPLKV